MTLLAQTVVTVPALLPTAVAVAAVLTAFGLVLQFIVRPIVRAARWVSDRLDELSSLVEQVRDLVQYVGISGADVEARFDRLEREVGLMPWKPTSALTRPVLREELTETQTRRVTREE